MSVTRIVLIAAMLLGTAGKTFGGKEAPVNYSHMLPLSVSGTSGIAVVRLPPAVYRLAQSETLADLRVFDAAGASIAFALQQPVTKSENISRLSRAAAIFPVYSSSATAANSFGSAEIDIRARADGSLISVRTKGEDKGTERRLSFLILDLGAAPESLGPDARVASVRFGLPPKHGTVTTRVHAEGSNDLQRWEAVGAAELSWLINADDRQLTADTIEFSARRYRYARISWRNGAGVAFDSATAEWVSQVAEAPVYDTAWLDAVEGTRTGELLYRSSRAIPVEWMDLRMADTNTVITADIGRYAITHDPRHRHTQPQRVFQPLWRKTFFQFVKNGETRRSDAVAIPPTHVEEWVIRPVVQQETMTGLPQLGIGWRPASLVFVAAGTPPYRLAFGRADAESAALPLAQVAPGLSPDEIATLERASVGDLVQLKDGVGNAAGHWIADLSPQQRRMVLWASLVLGVAILAAMAWHLLRQTSASSNSDHK